MKLAWLVWEYEDDTLPAIHFVEPDRWHHKVVPIVYTEVVPYNAN